MDIRGLLLVSAAAFGLVWGLVRGNEAGWGSGEVAGSLTGGLVLAGAFVAWELRARQPMLPMRLFRARGFAAGNAAIFFTFASLFVGVFFFAQLLQTGLGYGPLDAGLRLLPWTATFLTVAPIAGALADRIGERPLMVAGLALEATGLAWIALIADAHVTYGALLAPLVVAGVGVSMAIPAAQTSVIGSVEAHEIGKAAGVNSTLRELGGVFGIAVAVAVFASSGGYASLQDFTDGLAPAVAVAAGLALAGALAALGLPGGTAAPSVAGAIAAPGGDDGSGVLDPERDVDLLVVDL
jgi:Na+/melibiose symporter-like transporter